MNELAERLYVTAYCTGIGEKKASRPGVIAVERRKEYSYQDHESICIEVGRGSYGQKLAKAFAWLDLAKAHELACILMHLTHNEFPCQGGGIQNTKHSANMHVNLEFKADLCTILNNKEGIKAQVMAEVEQKLNDMLNTNKELVINATPTK